MVSVVLPLPLPPPSFDEPLSESLEQPASSPVASAATAATAMSLRDRRVLVPMCVLLLPDVPTPRPTALLGPFILAAARAGNVRDVYVSGTVGALPQVMC